jgi:hypothetical protein
MEHGPRHLPPQAIQREGSESVHPPNIICVRRFHHAHLPQVAAFPFIQRACAAPMHPASVLSFCFGTQRQMLLEHTQVLEQFGRYPHRNTKLGRPSTVDEQRWLDDTDQLPDWAKSQG